MTISVHVSVIVKSMGDLMPHNLPYPTVIQTHGLASAEERTLQDPGGKNDLEQLSRGCFWRRIRVGRTEYLILIQRIISIDVLGFGHAPHSSPHW